MASRGPRRGLAGTAASNLGPESVVDTLPDPAKKGDTGKQSLLTQVCTALRARGATGISTLVQPQRTGGVELLVGLVRDPAWGLTLAVGLGGVWVEVLRDSALRLLPVDRTEVRRALGELRGADLLRGARGVEPADLDALADVIARVGCLAEELGDRLESLEINPLLVRGSQIEALDALVTWRN